MINKQDYLIAALVGFLVGVFAIPTVINLGIRSKAILLVLPLLVPPLWVFGVWLGGFLGRWLPFMAQLGKFAAVGFLNAAIDFGTLNLLSAATNITKGLVIGGVNIPGFALAVMNSYFWNKFWVFKDRDDKGVFGDFPTFLAVTVVGLIINSGAVVVITTYISPFFGINDSAWLNFAKAVAAVVSLGWNFIGYKFFVFRSEFK
jgi:putative flippase GtrA